LNPTERLWQYTRRTGTHNRYFSNPAELVCTIVCFRQGCVVSGRNGMAQKQ
jgi:hypothetical protein